MGAGKPWHERTLVEQAALVQREGVSPVALTEHLLERIERLNPALNAFNRVLPERALAEARAAETLLRAGRVLGPLHGVPYAAKDIYDVAGEPTTAGSRLLVDNVAAADCPVVGRLAQAGMILLGKTITVEFAQGGVGINHNQGTPHNPWHRTPHVPGGSSAGSAVAVAAGLAPMALGSDTGGSVRIPASLCGTVGLKTTVGRITRHGVYPLSWTLDSVGPLTRGVEDAALVLDALQGPDARDGCTLGVPPLDPLGGLRGGLAGLRIAFGEGVFWEGCDAEVADAVRAAGALFERLGARVDSFELPEARPALELGGTVSGVEGLVANERLIAGGLELIDPVVALRMADNQRVSGAAYVKSLREMHRLRAAARRSLAEVDVLLVPATPWPARPTAAADRDQAAYMAHAMAYRQNTAIGNLLDLCGVSLPCGFTREGLPIGLLVYAKPFAEDVALRAAYAYEQAAEWRHRTPALDWAG